MITPTLVQQALRDARFREALVVVEACHSGAFAAGVALPRVRVVTSTDAESDSYELLTPEGTPTGRNEFAATWTQALRRADGSVERAAREARAHTFGSDVVLAGDPVAQMRLA